MVVGYVRVSTSDQNLDRQHDLMKREGVERVFEDSASGKDTKRKGLHELLAFVREGDFVVVESISRLARSTRDLLDICDQLQLKSVSLRSTKESLDTSTSQGRFVLTIFGALATLERESILERQKEGIIAAKARGRHLGRPKIRLPDNWTQVIAAWKSNSLSATEAMKKLGMKKTTFYKFARS